jgi:hypothetical protein
MMGGGAQAGKSIAPLNANNKQTGGLFWKL